jgi:hypothetical protein
MLTVIATAGVSAVEPGRAEAAATYTARTGTKSTIYLKPAEKCTVNLHNQIRGRGGLLLFCIETYMNKLEHRVNILNRNPPRPG